MKKKVLATVMSCMLAFAMLAGCGAAKDAADSGSNAVDASSDDAGAKEPSDAADDAATATDTDDVVTDADDAEGGEDGVVAFTTVNDGMLIMATNAYFPPYEYYEGDQITGIDAEIAAAIADKLGLELKIEDMEFDSILIAVPQGKADIGIAGMTVTDERKQSVNFTDSYATGIQSVIVKEDSDIASVADLEGKKIGVQLATTGDIYAKEDYGEENVEEYNKGADAVMALTQGKVDAVIIDNQPALSFVDSTDGLKILDTEYAIEDYAIAVSKENQALCDAINGALAELKEDGTIQTILDKYIK